MHHATVAYRYYKGRRPNCMYHAKPVDLSLEPYTDTPHSANCGLVHKKAMLP